MDSVFVLLVTVHLWVVMACAAACGCLAYAFALCCHDAWAILVAQADEHTKAFVKSTLKQVSDEQMSTLNNVRLFEP